MTPPTPSNVGEVRRWYYHLAALGVAAIVFAYSLKDLLDTDRLDGDLGITTLIAVPIIVIVSRFPMVLDRGSGGIEVGFDSSILMFLLCTLDPAESLVVWSVAVIVTQATSDKRLSTMVFNAALGILAGGLAAAIYAVGSHDAVGTPRELAAVAVAAAAYFVTDYVLSALSVAIGARSRFRDELVQRGTVLAIACFVPLDSLGYLGAIVQRSAPWWALTLLAVPLTTLLIATRAVTRGRENARRLTVLFSAAVRAQTLPDRAAVVEALERDAGQLLRLREVRVSDSPPPEGAIGVPVELGGAEHWLTARSMNRARATASSDEQALQALAAVASDAVARLELTDEMVHLARHDPLTDLPNRGILLDRMTDCLAHARRQHSQVALIFIDLDAFKPVNDRFGHAAGDAVLLELARRLRACVRPTDILARLGGDEFAILFEVAEAVDLPAACERILAAVSEGVDVAGQRVRVGASLGVAYGDGTESAAELLRNADLAMYEAKARGKGRYVEYEPAMGRARLDRLELIEDLRQAVDAGEIEVAYQPVVAVSSGRIIGVEALARWRRDDEPVPPDVFISVAEETGLINALGDGILDRVARDTCALSPVITPDFSISVNISAGQLREPGFVDTVARTVATMRGVGLILEITERQGVDLTGDVLTAMERVADMGVRFAIDDFGVGFSSIGYLHDLPAQVIKIDAALSQNADRDERGRALLRSVMLMGQALGFRVVVEGIERESQLEAVREDVPSACAQGFLLHRPMPLEQLIEVLRADARV